MKVGWYAARQPELPQQPKVVGSHYKLTWVYSIAKLWSGLIAVSFVLRAWWIKQNSCWPVDGAESPSYRESFLQRIDARAITSIAFGTFVIWTGLMRCVEAQAFKPNAFWFCLVTGTIAISASQFYQMAKPVWGTVLGLASAAVVFAYYLFTFITAPEQDATVRVALVIVAAIGYATWIGLPSKKGDE